VPRQTHRDPDIERVLGQISQRQEASQSGLDTLDPEALAFQLMRLIPREHWGKNWPDVSPEIYKRGQQDRGFAMSYPFNMWSPGLRKLTPGKTIEQLFNLPGMIRAESTQRKTQRAATSQTQ
jgi:hypothetical protein